MSAVRFVTQAVFLLCVPLLLLLSNVRIASTWGLVYDYAFSQYDAPAVTGVPRPELDRAGREIVTYFQEAPRGALLDVSVRRDGQIVPLFTEREVAHMRDVLGLMRSTFHLQEFAFTYVVVYVAGVYLWSRERSLLHLARMAMWTGAATAISMGLAAIAMLVGFDSLFTQFHLLSFSNDFWQLDPATDRLVQMFPQGFWFDVSLAVGVVTVAEGGLLFLGGYYFLAWWERRRPRRMRRARLANLGDTGPVVGGVEG